MAAKLLCFELKPYSSTNCGGDDKDILYPCNDSKCLWYQGAWKYRAHFYTFSTFSSNQGVVARDLDNTLFHPEPSNYCPNIFISYNSNCKTLYKSTKLLSPTSVPLIMFCNSTERLVYCDIWIVTSYNMHSVRHYWYCVGIFIKHWHQGYNWNGVFLWCKFRGMQGSPIN